MTHIECTFPSSVLGTLMHVDVLLPRPEDLAFATHQKSPKPPFACLYLLHGLRESGETWLLHTDIAALCDRLSLAIVLPSCGNFFYLDTPDGFPVGTYLTDELYHYTHEIFPLSGRREDNFIGGNSMGGFGACVAALQHADLYSKVISFSGALSVRKAGIFAHAVEVPFPASLYHVDKNAYDLTKFLADVPADHAPSFWLTCPPSDLFYQENVRFYEAAVRRHISCELHTPKGNHDWTFWKSQVEDAFAFLARKD